MTLMVENNQDTYGVDKIQKIVTSVYSKVLETKNIKNDCQVSVILTDNKGIQHLNHDFRGIDFPTDVLSFPMINYKNGELFSGTVNEEDIDMDTNEVVLGDVVISLERAEEQSKEYGHSFEREVAFLMVHGMLHLLGYDHEIESDKLAMREEEERILNMLGHKR